MPERSSNQPRTNLILAIRFKPHAGEAKKSVATFFRVYFGQLLQLMDNCRVVAIETQAR